MKRIFIDTETSGTDPRIHGLWQIAAIIESGSELQEFKSDSFIHQDKNCAASWLQSSLSMQYRKSLEACHLCSAIDAKHAFTQLLDRHVDKYNKADKFQFIAYNAKFDFDFIHEWFKDNGDNYCGSYFWFPPIDVAQIAFERIDAVTGGAARFSLKDFKLGTVCRNFGIDFSEEEAHDAMYDIRKTMDLYNILKGK